MNTITIVVTVFVLWLVMGLGFTSAYFDAKRKGKTNMEAWTSNEGLLFIASLLAPLLIAAYRLVT